MSDAPSFDILDKAAYQRALAALVDVGVSIVQETKTPSDTVSLPERAKAYDAVSLAVRRAILLSQHVDHYVPPKPALSPDEQRTLDRQAIIRAVGDEIERKADPAETASLRVELLERLDSPDFEAGLISRSPAQLIKELCRDLGLANDIYFFPRRTPEDIAILCAQAAAPAGSGLAQWLAATAAQATLNDAPPNIRLKEH